MYPLEIAPRSYFARRINTDKLAKMTPGFIVCRTIDKPVGSYITRLYGGRNELDPDCFGEHVVRMSLNIMGSCLKEDHLRFRPVDTGRDEWKGEDINPLDYADKYKDNVKGYPLYYSATSLHRRIYPAPLSFGTSDKGKYNALRAAVKSCILDSFSGQNTVTVETELFLLHKPTKLNYWHIQMEAKLMGDEDEDLFRNKNSWRGDLYQHITTNVLCRDFIEHPDTIPTIPNCSYCRLSRKCHNR